MLQLEPVVYVLSGPKAAGKTTVARLLVARFARGVHVEGDVRHSLAGGREAIRDAARAVDTHFQAGSSVVLEDTAAGPFLGEYRTAIRSRPCHVVVLLPSREAVAERDAGRQAAASYGTFESDTARVGVWLDTTELTPDETVDAILARTASIRSPIVISDYDRTWPQLFEEIAAAVREATADLGARVEHVGSTAVPGLAAKPVIDMDVVVPSTEDLAPAIERLHSLGYVYQGDKGVAGREALLWPPGSPRHHLYVVVEGSRALVDHIAFRDYLRRRPEAAHEYAALKRALASRLADDSLGYTEAKDEFVAHALRAGATANRLVSMAIETEPVCWLHLPPDDDAPDAVKELWATPLEKLGFVPNVLRAYAIRPRHLELWNAFYDELMRGESGLTKAQREMIAVVVSTANRCHYCIVSHSAALRKLTGDPLLVEQLQTNHAYANVDAKERAMLDFALKLTERSSSCTEADVDALREAGWSDEEIMDITQVAAMFNFTNRLASGLGWRPNPEYVNLGR